MPTNRTKRTRNRAGALDHWKVDQLMTGKCLLAGVGYAGLIKGGGCNHWTSEDWEKAREAMRADWAIHGRDLMAWWRGETERFTDRFTSREKLNEWGVTHPWADGMFGGDQ